MLEYIKGMEMLTECKAWQDFLSGDNDAYSVIYNTYIGELYTYAMCFTKDRTLAEDAIHDVFVKIYSERDKLHHVKSIRQYLYSSVRNRILNLLRKAEMSENFNELDGLDIIGDSLVEKQYEAKEKNAIEKAYVKRMFSVLSSRQKELVYYRFVKGLSYEEIGDIMGLTYQSLQNLLQRAFSRLRKTFSQRNSNL